MDTPLKVVDLFCGAGGMSQGFSKAGFDVILAVDKNKAAVRTYSKNFGHPALELDLANTADIPSATVIVGGPPCQGFSSAGSRRSDDSRNTLVGVFARIVAQQLPSAFVFENVEGFLTGNGGAHVLELIEPLVSAGYRIHLKKINAANYGVPQNRKRVVAIGGLGWDPTFTEATHAAFGTPGANLHSRHLPLAPTVAEALAGLPRPTSSPQGHPQGHFFNELTGSALSRAEHLLAGMTMRDLPVELQHESYRRRADRRVSDGTPTERRGGAPAGIRRLSADEPSKAITSGARTEFLHPSEHRNLTLRECARLQTFDDDFQFAGNASEQALLIGNAVPPLLAFKIACGIRRDLESSRTFHNRGALLSFVPTMSSGMSPALHNTARLVKMQSRLEYDQETFPFASV
ncbi:DNA (cytosine-5)-methyltransferase 1 [Granulicella rosea]|uniref:DNA (cytosine-5-)-methyltransferase n=1 Tax=Granulicella rosea TaxID=474952 RepID=A0A239KUE2_9BACT|nr:DNA cytosine methyltransferase [Granulicella rosea]SNT21640.1 DNA (cytosine-5)-methyltransferase 1 [Granulicella rosea]